MARRWFIRQITKLRLTFNLTPSGGSEKTKFAVFVGRNVYDPVLTAVTYAVQSDSAVSIPWGGGSE